jgi:hypothetical protein
VKKSLVGVLALAVAVLPACSSKRQISVEDTGSTRVQGTSWYRFCDGPNAFIWVQSRTDSEPDELEAVIYDHWACVDGPTTNDNARGDDDGIVEDEEN